jgi:TatD DNase family protein
MHFIDTHCHLYLDAFDADRSETLEMAQKLGVQQFFLPAIDSTHHIALLQLEAHFPNCCFAMMGLHPCSVAANNIEELQLVEQYLQQRPFKAIGEIGLDYYWDTNFAHQQLQAFNQQMQWALELQLPVVIHTRNAMQETINAVKPFAKKGLRGIFHCFSGSYESAQQIINMHFLLGIGGVITYKNARLPQALEKIGLEHFVLETDAPYLSPVPYRGKRNQSSYIPLIAAKLAEVKQTSLETIAAVTTNNAQKLFGI